MLITRMTPRASEKPLARMKRSAPNAIPLMMSPSTLARPFSVRSGTTSRGRRRVAGGVSGYPPLSVLVIISGDPPSASPLASLRVVSREGGMAQELFGRLRPKLAWARDRREHLLVVLRVDLEDVQVIDRVVVDVHGKRPAGRDLEFCLDDRVDKLLRVLGDPARHGAGAHSGLLAVVRDRLVDPVGRRVRRLAPVRWRLAAVRLLPVCDERLCRRRRRVLAVLV